MLYMQHIFLLSFLWSKFKTDFYIVSVTARHQSVSLYHFAL